VLHNFLSAFVLQTQAYGFLSSGCNDEVLGIATEVHQTVLPLLAQIRAAASAATEQQQAPIRELAMRLKSSISILGSWRLAAGVHSCAGAVCAIMDTAAAVAAGASVILQHRQSVLHIGLCRRE
jgi:pantothenate kinase